MEGRIEFRYGIDGNPRFISVPDYVYCLRTVGSFFSEENSKWHKIIRGEYFFKNKKDRDEFIDRASESYNTFRGIGDIQIDCAEGYGVYKRKGIKFIFNCISDDKLICLEYPLPLSFTLELLKRNNDKIHEDAKKFLDKNKEYELVSAILYGEWDMLKLM